MWPPYWSASFNYSVIHRSHIKIALILALCDCHLSCNMFRNQEARFYSRTYHCVLPPSSGCIKLTIILTVEAAELMFPHSAHYKAMDHLCPSQVCVHNDTSSATHSWYLSHSRRTQRQSFSVLTLFSYREGVHHHPTDRHEFSQETKYNRVCHSLLSTSIIQEMRAN